MGLLFEFVVVDWRCDCSRMGEEEQAGTVYISIVSE